MVKEGREVCSLVKSVLVLWRSIDGLVHRLGAILKLSTGASLSSLVRSLWYLVSSTEAFP